MSAFLLLALLLSGCDGSPSADGDTATTDADTDTGSDTGTDSGGD